MPFSRPNGVSCSGYIYPDKKNTYEKLKEFLFDETTGRTDVVFLASAASAYEPNQHTHATNAAAYHYTGGLIDGMAKAIIQGSATRSPRSLYATGVQFAYTCNQIPGFDRWNSSTWISPNNTGVGGYLTGCSTAYDSYFYYLQTTVLPENATPLNSQTGLHLVSYDPNQTYPYFDAFDSGTTINVPINELWSKAFNDVNNIVSPSANKDLKYKAVMGQSLNRVSTRDNLLSKTVPWNITLTITPEQPQRYWDREVSWYIKRTDVIPIGIAEIDPGTDTISSIFPDALSFGYIPAGLTVGMSLDSAKALLPAGKLSFATLNSEGYFQINNFVNSSATQTWFPSRANDATSWNNKITTVLGNKKLLVRLLSVDDIITIRSLNIAANNSGITNYTTWKAVDGYRNGDYVVFRSPWANPETSAPTTEVGSDAILNSKVLNKYGLCTSSDSGASSSQFGLPYIWAWGNRITCLATNAFNYIDWAMNRFTPYTESPSNTTQLSGFPRTLSTICPSGFFRLTAADSAKVTNPSFTKFQERCIIIKPSAGKFFDSIVTQPGGFKSTTTKELIKAEKNISLGMFKSSSFKYCVNTYTIDKYASDALSSTSLLRLTAFSTTAPATPLTSLATSNITQTNPIIPDGETRTVQRHNNILSIDLSTVNNNFQLHEIRLGFLGKGSSPGTNGDLLITTHFGIDTANQHGIAFSKLDTSFAFRSGDAAYQVDAGYSNGGRSSLYLEFFKAIHERQTSSTFNAINGISPKLVIMMEVGIWESANPNFSYNGFNTWSYFVDELPLVGNGSNGVTGYGFGFDALTPIINTAIIAGFTRNNIVVCFYTPTQITKVNVPGSGTFDGVSYNTALDEATYITTKNNRATFIRATEIFINNNITWSGGYYTPTPPAPPLVFDGVSNPAAKNSVYLNFGNMTGLGSILTNIDGFETTWYDNTDDVLTYRYYSEGGALAIGSWVMDYLAAQTSQTFFVPPWIPSFSRALNFTTDPVSGADLNLVTVSLDPVDIEPYLASFDLLCDQGNIQAKKTLSKLKTKILQ